MGKITIKAQGQGSGGSSNAVLPWKTTGNSATTSDFMGTTNQQSLILKANNTQLMELNRLGEIIFSKMTSSAGDGIVKIGGGGKIDRIDFTHNFDHVLNGQGIFTSISTFTGLKLSGQNIIQTTTGNIGIGAATPSEKISVVGGGSFTGNLGIGGSILANTITTNTLSVSTLSVNSLSASTLNVSSLAGGTGLTEVFVDANGNLKTIIPCCGGTLITPCSNTNTPWRIGGNTLGTVQNAVIGTCDFHDFVLEANNIPYMWLKPDGKLGIGTSNPTGLVEIQSTANSSTPTSPFIISSTTQTQFNDLKLFEVTFDGKAYAREFFVQVTDFPDYVFKKGYKLTPLPEVENYFLTNQHLKNMPSAKEVEKNGANLGEIQRVSVEKIEDIYLYLIEMKKEIQSLQKENKELKKRLNK